MAAETLADKCIQIQQRFKNMTDQDTNTFIDAINLKHVYVIRITRIFLLLIEQGKMLKICERDSRT